MINWGGGGGGAKLYRIGIGVVIVKKIVDWVGIVTPLTAVGASESH